MFNADFLCRTQGLQFSIFMIRELNLESLSHITLIIPNQTNIDRLEDNKNTFHLENISETLAMLSLAVISHPDVLKCLKC